MLWSSCAGYEWIREDLMDRGKSCCGTIDVQCKVEMVIF